MLYFEPSPGVKFDHFHLICKLNVKLGLPGLIPYLPSLWYVQVKLM